VSDARESSASGSARGGVLTHTAALANIAVNFTDGVGAVFDDYKRAQTELSRRQVEVEEIKRGIRNAAPPEKSGPRAATRDAS